MNCSFVFIIDISDSAVRSQFTLWALETVQCLVAESALPGGPRASVAVLAFSSEVHLLRLDGGSPKVFSFIKDSFLPVPSECCLVHSEDKKLEIVEILETLKGAAGTGSSAGVREALGLAKMLLNSGGGKFLLFLDGNTVNIENTGNFRVNYTEK